MGIRVNPQQHYQSVSDSELQSLAEQYDQLMPDAQQALLAELQRRGSTEGIQTAKSVEAGTNEGLKYLTITDASGRLTGSFRVIAPRISILKFPKFCPCGKPANKELGVGAAHITGSVFPISPVLIGSRLAARIELDHGVGRGLPRLAAGSPSFGR